MRAAILLTAGLVLAGTSGFLTSMALSAGAPPPTKTVTVDVGTGEKGEPGPPGPAGPAGPAGPPGPAGDFSCLAGYEPGILVLNAPGGQVRIYTCIQS